MSGFFGADTGQLRDHAQRVTQQAQRLSELRETLEPMVLDESIWQGPDADAFRQNWTGSVATLFDLRHTELSQRARDLEAHAEEQDAASGAGGAGGSGAGSGGGGGEDGFSPIGFIKDLVKDGQSMYLKLKELSDFLGRIPSAADEYAQLAQRGLQKLWRGAYLDELFSSGKGWQKAAENVLGKLGLPSSIGNFEPGKYLNKLDDVAPFLKTGGRMLGKALPFVDIGVGIHQAFTADNTYDQVSGGIGAAGGTLLAIAPLTGPAAPVVGAIGAAAGVVSIGMDLGKTVYENWDGITNAVGNAAEATVGAVSNAASTVSDAVGNAAETVGETVSNTASTVSDAVGNAAESVGDTVSDGLDSLGGLVGL
ncbi:MULTISPECIES: hypothetical protein [unclassified Brachybacterium]|uniref:hypothetical protein n=1 Tax=unclassified Brachybacterium TaxID=2623841 RepID=UPI00361301C1